MDVRVKVNKAAAEIRAAVAAAIAECAEAVAEQARADCPVETGKLRDSIGVEVSADEAGVIEAQVIAAAPYAAAVELGERPFLWPAAEEQGAELPARLRRHSRL